MHEHFGLFLGVAEVIVGLLLFCGADIVQYVFLIFRNASFGVCPCLN